MSILTAVVSLTAALLLAPASPAQNLVRNPGFETVAEGGKAPAVWPVPTAPGVQFARDTAVAHTGAASGRIHGTAPEKQTRFVQAWRQAIPLEPGKRYWLSTWVKADQTTAGRVAVLHRDKTQTVLLNQTLESFTGTFGWRQLGGLLKQVEGAVDVQLVIGIQRSGGTAWFDDVELTETLDADTGLGTWEFVPAKPLTANTRTPVTVRFTLGRRGLVPGGTITLRWDRWRPAREFRFSQFAARAPGTDATFSVTVPPRKKSWPPIRQPVACVVTMLDGAPLGRTRDVLITAQLVPSRYSNVISPLRAGVAAAKGTATRWLPDAININATGGKAEQLRCVAVMRPVQGRPGRVTVALLDRHGNPAQDFRGTIELSCPGSDLPAAYTFTEQDGGSHTFPATFTLEGVSRVRVAWNEMQVSSNPILPRPESEPGVFFGDIHSHCEVSGDGVGDPDLAHDYARRFFGLDFACLSDHSPTGERWKRIMAVNNRHNAPGSFVALLGYEWSSKTHGHRNAYFPLDSAPSQPRGLKNNTTEWWALLDKQGIEAITVPHHTNTQAAQIMSNGQPAWGPADWSVINHKYQRVVEICQNRGSFEVPGPNKELRVARKDVGASVQAALGMGHRLAFIGSTDTHSGRPGTGQARCVVLTNDLTRRGVWQALHDRRCYATTGPHIFVNFTLNGNAMGSQLRVPAPDTPRRIRWRVVGTTSIQRVELLRNNEVAATVPGKGKDDLRGQHTALLPCTKTEWWYLRVLQDDTHIAWSSPIWVDVGD